MTVMQKRLNQSICRLGCGLRWAEGSTGLIVCACWRQCVLMGGHIAWRQVRLAIEPSICGGDAALCEIL